MEIGPAKPVFKQFRINTWSPDASQSSAQTETFARNSWSDGTKVGYVIAKSETPPDTERPAHKLRTALKLPSIPPVTVELPETSTRPSSSTENPQGRTEGGLTQSTSLRPPTGESGGLMSSRIAPPSGGVSTRPAFGLQVPPTLPEAPGALTQGRPTLPTEVTQSLKAELITPLPREVPEDGPLTQSRPAPPEYRGLNGPGIQSAAELSPPNTSPLPPLPLAEVPEEKSFEDGTPKTEADNADETQTRARIKRLLAERSTVLAENQGRRAEQLESRANQIQARVAREASAPPAHGAEAKLIARHSEPPFDPEARSSLSVTPRRERGRVARKDSVLYDQVGANRRVQGSASRADQAIERQREVGRREFEARQRRNADAVQGSEERNEARRLAQLQRLEAAELEDISARAEARKQAIEREFVDRQELRERARQNFYAAGDRQTTAFNDLVSSATRARVDEFNANVSTRATAVKERQRDVFDLQLQFAEQRQFVQDNPLNAVGDESTKNLEFSRTGNEKFKAFSADKSATLDRLEEQRADKVAEKNRSKRAQNDERMSEARERSQNVRRRLASTYSGARAAATSRGRL